MYKKRYIAVIGTVGVPANYGGFEALVENIISYNEDAEFTVFCSARSYSRKLQSYKGARLVYVPFLHANGAESIPYDIVSMLMCVGRGFDTVLILGVSGCIFLPIFSLLFRGRIVVNIDGLEHKRDKWGKAARWFLRTSEAVAVRYADVVVSDNKGIYDYVVDTYGKQSELIAYGGDQALCSVAPDVAAETLLKHDLVDKQYAITVCRIEPENNCHVILDAFAGTDKLLVFVGNWDKSEYGIELKNRYSHYDNIHILPPIYDLDVLYVLRSNARWYIHGHSAGGTNPSLVEAMYFRIPIIAFDVVYNRATTEDSALYFSNAETLRQLILSAPDSELEAVASVMKEIADRRYRWDIVAKQYAELY